MYTLVWYLTRHSWAYRASHCIAAISDYSEVFAVSIVTMLWATGRA